MKPLFLLYFAVCATVCLFACAQEPGTGPWPAEKAWKWHNAQPWTCGFNYVPSTACNTTEFWGADTFDAPTITRELALARSVGFTSCRVFIQYLVWKNDPDGLKKRLDRFLTIAAENGISVVPTLFDDCTFGNPPVTEPYLGRQRDPIPGMILPSWTPSPGLSVVTDHSKWPDLQRYVEDLTATFAKDKRILFWDLYNEPGNSNMGDKSLPLVEAVFDWARHAEPEQPLTIAMWSGMELQNKVIAARSDIITFHAYTNLDGMKTAIAAHKQHGRPAICSEWMSRQLGAHWDTDLPLFKQENVSCYCWGLVNGRTQAQFSWTSKKGDPEPAVWFHDLFHGDGTPYDIKEIDAIRRICGDRDAQAALDQAIQCAEGDGHVDVSESGVPILQYSYGNTAVPEGIGGEFARGDYVSALYGLKGELLTEDYPKDHPHHRAVNWSWATIQWNGEMRDLFAVRGIWARPAGKPRVETADGSACISADNVWKWDDKTPVVAESANIHVFPRTEEGRAIDFDIRLTALVDNLEFCGRLDAGYSGFNIRMAPAPGQEIVFHTDPAGAQPRRAWADYSAEFTGGKERSGLAILQSADDPLYPQEWRKYPELNFFQPLYPGGRLIPMAKDKRVLLRYRLWIHPGGADESALAGQWDRYNRTPQK